MDFSFEERPLEEYYSRDFLSSSGGGKNHALATCQEDMPTFHEHMFDASGSTASLTDRSYNGGMDFSQEDDGSITYDEYDNNNRLSNNTSSLMGKSSRRATLEFMLSRGSLRCDNVMDLYNASSEFQFDPIREEEQLQHYYQQQQQQLTQQQLQNEQKKLQDESKNNNSFQNFWEARVSTFTNNMSVIQANWNDWFNAEPMSSSNHNNHKRTSNTSTISSLSTSTTTQQRQQELQDDVLPDLHPMTKDNNQEEDDGLEKEENPIQKFVQDRRNTFVQNVEFVKRESKKNVFSF